MADMEGVPSLYLQPLQSNFIIGPELPSPEPPIMEEIVYSSYSIGPLVDWGPVFYCDSSQGMRYGDDCWEDLDALDPGQSMAIGGYILALYYSEYGEYSWYWPSYTLRSFCSTYTKIHDVPGDEGKIDHKPFCKTEEDTATFLSTLNLLEFGGGGSCIQVTPLDSLEDSPHIARAEVTRQGCCEEDFTFSGDAIVFEGQAFQESIMGTLAIKIFSPDDCVDTTLTIDDSQNHANIVKADGTDTTTLTVSLSKDPAGTVTRYLEADFGTVPSSVMLSSDNATATYTAGTLTQGSTATTAATVKVLRASGDQQSLDEVKVFNYSGFNFTELMNKPTTANPDPTSIADNQMIVAIPPGWTNQQVATNMDGDAGEIQMFLQQQGSFLASFYLSTHTKEGFYDGDGGRAGQWDPGIDTVYEAPSGQNSAGNATRGNRTEVGNHPKWDNCTGEGEQRRCGEMIAASVLIARFASCQNAVDANFGTSSFDCTRRSHRVTPKNMLVTLQKEHSLVAETGYPATTELNDAMGCNERIMTTQNFFDQIGCGADTFVRRYTETHFGNPNQGGRRLNFPFFFRLSDGLFHGGITPHTEGGDPVAFSVQNRLTYVQYRYTNWIQSDPTGGGVYLFYELWNEERFNYPWRD